METMINLRTPICAYRASIVSTVQTQAMRSSPATHTLQNNESAAFVLTSDGNTLSGKFAFRSKSVCGLGQWWCYSER